MRVLAVAFVLLLLLAGCSSSPAASTTGSTSSLSASTSSGPAPKPVPPTDTLHFAVAPDMVLQAPKASEPNETELPASGFGGGGGGGGGSTGAEWEYTLRSNGTLSAFDATIWVRVVDQLVGLPEGEPSCPWSVQAAVRSPDQGGQDPNKVHYSAVCSGPGGPTVAPGDYELSFSATAPNGAGAFAAGDTLVVTVSRTLTSPTPNTSVFVLTGAKDFDSRIMFTGLKEPVTLA